MYYITYILTVTTCFGFQHQPSSGYYYQPRLYTKFFQLRAECSVVWGSGGVCGRDLNKLLSNQFYSIDDCSETTFRKVMYIKHVLDRLVVGVDLLRANKRTVADGRADVAQLQSFFFAIIWRARPIRGGCQFRHNNNTVVIHAPFYVVSLLSLGLFRQSIIFWLNSFCCLKAAAQPLTERIFHRLRSSTSSFNFQYLLQSD